MRRRDERASDDMAPIVGPGAQVAYLTAEAKPSPAGLVDQHGNPMMRARSAAPLGFLSFKRKEQGQ